jgi:hypothetical protein
MILKLKVWLLKRLLNDVAKKGIEGDVHLAHINKFEDKLLKAVGGEGSVNPKTGLKQYKGGGGGQSQNTSNTLDPNIVPYVTDALSKQQQLYNQGAPSYYGGQTYVDPSSQTNMAMQMGEQRAMDGNPLVGQAQETVGNLQTQVNPAMAGYNRLQGGSALTNATARGDYLQNNPNFDRVMATAGRKVSDIYNTATNNTFSDVSRAGRYGSNAHANLQAGNAGKLAQSLSDTAGQYSYQNYANERGMQENAINNQFNQQMQATQGMGALSEQQAGRQLQASQMAPSLAQADYQDIDRLAQYGKMREGYDQTALNSDIARHDYGQNAQQQHLANYTNAVWGAPGGSQSTTTSSGGGK